MEKDSIEVRSLYQLVAIDGDIKINIFHSSISQDEKLFIKRKLLESFKEPNDQHAVQLAVVISKIARLDCPHEWPELMPVGVI